MSALDKSYCYRKLEEIDIEKYRREESWRRGREISTDEIYALWDITGRAKQHHDYFTREHARDSIRKLIKLIEEESKILKIKIEDGKAV